MVHTLGGSSRRFGRRFRVYAAYSLQNSVGSLSEGKRAARVGDWADPVFHQRCSRRAGGYGHSRWQTENFGFRSARLLNCHLNKQHTSPKPNCFPQAMMRPRILAFASTTFSGVVSSWGVVAAIAFFAKHSVVLLSLVLEDVDDRSGLSPVLSPCVLGVMPNSVSVWNTLRLSPSVNF